MWEWNSLLRIILLDFQSSLESDAEVMGEGIIWWCLEATPPPDYYPKLEATYYIKLFRECGGWVGVRVHVHVAVSYSESVHVHVACQVHVNACI